MSNSNQCQCEIAGGPAVCPMHNMLMAARQREQCRRDERFFQLFHRFGECQFNNTNASKGKQSRSLKSSKSKSEKRGCGGCTKRKETMNKIIPKSGDAVEYITEKTGLKDWWENKQ